MMTMLRIGDDTDLKPTLDVKARRCEARAGRDEV